MRVVDSEGAEEEWARGERPGSGLWALLGWLRRAGSADSLSSAGSARTAASFAFLAPPPARARAAPAPRPAPPPASDLSLRRKYGLYYGYDAFSLPPRRHLGADEHERRATSESLPRRPHVPGKRRAPPPPARPRSLAGLPAPAARRRPRKRPAPPPPAPLTLHGEPCDTIHAEVEAFEVQSTGFAMKPNSERDRSLLSHKNGIGPNEAESTKWNGKENFPERKILREKSFFRQIFENKKRHSAIEPADRLLPSISELDTQAAQIIAACKLKPVEQNNNSNLSEMSSEVWFCTKCLRKYNSTVVTCQHCLPEQKRLSLGFKGESSTQTEKKQIANEPSTSRIKGGDEYNKQKLKEMLKEMKDSLPKRSKQDQDRSSSTNVFRFDSTGRNSSSETATLRIGAGVSKEKNTGSSENISNRSSYEEISISDLHKTVELLPKTEPDPVTQDVVITQHVVLVAPQSETVTKDNKNICTKANERIKVTEGSGATETNKISTPLRISSLLNPVYIPKSQAVTSQAENVLKSPFIKSFNTGRAENIAAHDKPVSTSSVSPHPMPTTSKTELTIVKTSAIAEINPKCEKESKTENVREKDVSAKTHDPPAIIASTSAEKKAISNKANADATKAKIENKQDNNSNVIEAVNQHAKRRNLVNQLEQSIAKGDEKAAAEAAVRLAQLRLSCSVLSFTSQIVAGTSGGNKDDLVNVTSVKQLEERQPNITKTPKVSGTPVDKKIESVNENVPQDLSIPQHLNKTKNAVINSRPVKTEEAKQQHPAQNPVLKVNASVQSLETVVSKNKAKEQRTQAQIHESKPSTSSVNLQVQRPAIKEHGFDVANTSKQSSQEDGNNLATIQVWVEDRETTRGPLRLRIGREARMGDLRREAEASFGLAGALQRWIVGRALCSDDRTPLAALAGPNLSTPFYLCVVAAENINKADLQEKSNNKDPHTENNGKDGDVYSELVKLEQKAIITNTEQFECCVCIESCEIGNGVILRECLHTFCRECLSDLVRHSEEPVVSCPAMGCPGVLQEREVRALVSPEEYERWLARGLAAAESGTRNAFHCRTRDCTGWALFDPEVRRFPCPVCKHTNCIPCQAIHEGETCEQHIKRLEDAAAATNGPNAQTDEGTKALLDTLMKKGEALECPECSAIITKKWGCDWIKCSACKTEICWVTRGRRWGPGGKGDTSAGCRCGVDGKRCHPSCGYCH